MDSDPRTLALTERKAALCRLDGTDVEFLLEHHRTHLDLRPTHETGVFQIRPRGYVGVINAPHTRISIGPKIPLQNLCWLLNASDSLDMQDDLSALEHGDSLINLLALRLARLMAERAAAGLRRGYRTRREVSSLVQGKIDVPEQLRRNPAQKDRVACEFEDWTTDVYFNQLPKSTAEWLSASHFITNSTRQQLRNSLRAFEGVSSIDLRRPVPILWQLGLVPEYESYRSLLYLCRLLLESLTASERPGTATCPSFLLSLEKAFETYCTRQLIDCLLRRDGGKSFWVIAQHPSTPHPLLPGLPQQEFRPDIVITPNGRHKGLLVMDIKWKSSPFVRADLYQVLAYCAAFGFRQGMLVYPGSRNRIWRYDFSSGTAIHIQQLRVTGEVARCQQATKRWLRQVAQICRHADS